MQSTVNSYRSKLSAAIDHVPDVLVEIMTSSHYSPQVRLKAAQDLMDRFGPHAVKAQMTQSVSATIQTEKLLEMREVFSREEKALSEGMRRLEAAMSGEEDVNASQIGEAEEGRGSGSERETGEDVQTEAPGGGETDGGEHV